MSYVETCFETCLNPTRWVFHPASLAQKLLKHHQQHLPRLVPIGSNYIHIYIIPIIHDHHPFSFMAVVHSCQSYRIWQSWKSINHDPLLTANSTVGHSKRFFMYHSYPLKTTAASWINHHLKNASITTPSLMLKSLYIYIIYIYIKGHIYIYKYYIYIIHIPQWPNVCPPRIPLPSASLARCPGSR